MAIDVYSPCPGGTGKKIKFCCPDLLGELQTIERMLDGEQFQACLSHVQGLLAKTPDRACLLATQSLLLRATQQWEAAQKATEQFLSKHPNNPIAWAEKAILAANDEGGQAAMKALQRAMVAGGETLPLRVYEAIGTVTEALISEGQSIAAINLLLLQSAVSPDDPEPAQLASALCAAPDVPLLVKSERSLPHAPADAPWKAKYEKAIEPIRFGQWAPAAEQLAEVLKQVGDQPTLWRAMATLRGWLADIDGCAEALRKFATLDVPREDAVEALALALLLAEDPLGDKADLLSVTFTVKDVEQLQTALASSRQILLARIDPMAFAEGDEPPPKSIYTLCDRPQPESGAELTLENTPRIYCQALLYGRQTDREARLELRGVPQWLREEVKGLLRSVVGEWLTEPVTEESIDKMSRTQGLLLPNFRPPDGATVEQARQLNDAHQADALYNRWVQLPLGYLDGKTPRQAAGLEAYRLRVLAAIMLIESWFESRPEQLDFNRLRENLGLPVLGPLDAAQVDLRTLPLVRLARVEPASLSDEQLTNTFHIATTFHARLAVRRFGQAILDRPAFAEKPERLEVYAMLARFEGPSNRGLEYIELGRKGAKALKWSCATWDLLELSYRYARAEGDQMLQIMEHLQSQHLKEPGVQESLLRFLMRIGAIRPDGTMAAPATAPAAEPAAVPGAAAAEPGKLWTPEGQRPAEERKIWLPGME